MDAFQTTDIWNIVNYLAHPSCKKVEPAQCIRAYTNIAAKVVEITMNISTRPFVVALCSGVLAAGLTASARQAPPPLGPLVLPAGFQADVFAENVENARSMALGPQGTVFVGSQFAGKVYAVVDRDGDHKADRVVMIASGLNQPNGVAMRNGALYVATASRLLRFDDIEKHLDAPPAPVTVRDNLPNPNAGHTWKFIAFGPDDMLYMSVGSTCNVCAPAAMTAAIVRMKPDGSGWRCSPRACATASGSIGTR